MATSGFEQIEADIERLSVPDQLRLMERLARLIRQRAHPAPTVSHRRVIYALPDPRIHSKFYNKDARFKDVDWGCWSSVIDGFQERFTGWYFDFFKGEHQSYVDFCSLCALVDVFTYYDGDEGDPDWHDPRRYKEFLRKLDSTFRKRLRTPITTSRCRSGKWSLAKLKDYADVFYAGVRCSLHHHGDLAAFAGMKATGDIASESPNAGSSLCGEYSYSLVIFDPAVLKEALEKWLRNYCAELKENPSSKKAKAFRTRFHGDFGIRIIEASDIA
jgi:hypothetical protein